MTAIDVSGLNEAHTKLVDLAFADFRKLVIPLAELPANQVREAMLAGFPVLVEKYGEVAAAAAAEFYQDARAAAIGGSFDALLSAVDDVEDVRKQILWATSELPESGLSEVAQSKLSGILQQRVIDRSRETVLLNVKRDPLKPRWARVPRGAKTCAFCMMLASRGFEYVSRKSASTTFHAHCDCVVVPGWGENPKVRGYRPEKFRKIYDASAVSGDLKATLANMRRDFPDLVSDAT